MELNNKFGACCKCPALMADARLFTSYLPRKDLNNNMMTELNAKNSNQYRDILQTHGENIAKSVNDELEKKYKCTENGNNKFYQVDEIDSYFNNILKATLNEQTDITSFYPGGL